ELRLPGGLRLVGVAFTAAGLTGMLIGPFSGRVSDLVGRPPMMAVGVLLAAAAAALFFVVALPATEVRGLTVSGASSIDGAELLAWASLPEKAYWFSVDAASVEARLSAHPRIESVSVARRFPNRLVVSVVERAPVAVVFARNREGRMEAHCVDGHGVVFAPARAFPEASGLPVLSGLEIRGMRYGIRLEGPFSPLLASLADIRRSEPLLSSAISELRVVSREGAPAELLLYPANYRVPVRMRLALDAGLLKSMMLVLDVVEGEGLSPSIRELDLRTDTFVYRTKEAVSG
ncbi:MAG: FtsQ-type POTRA domain-containing protein, partial [Spirochaetes bacterium]|nr:FtsQ-type POTRA domain-containing protein [Spirochaetota bacterium]